MKALLFLATVCVLSTFDTVCHAQLTADQLRAIQSNQRQFAEYAERLSKAEKAGIGLFGAEGQNKIVMPPQMNGTIAAKTPLEFEVGDWGCTSQIFEVVNVVSPTEILVLPI